MKTFLVGARLFTAERTIDDHGLLIEDGRILDLLPLDGPSPAAARVDLPAGSLLAPGFIDVQVNGAGGLLFNEAPTAASAMAIARALRPSGTTGLLPTFITDDRDRMRAAGEAAAEAVARPGSGVLGIHIEGPFISPKRPGCHAVRAIRAPDAADIDALTALSARLAADHGRVLLTLAPEEVANEAIARFAGAGIVVAIGHTAATFERVAEALAHGVRGFTHLGNAMPPIVNRDPGPVIAALDAADAWCGVIADGIHVHPGLLRVMHAAKRPGKLVLVTDAMPPVGTDATEFRLYGETIRRRDGRLTNEAGVLAGADVDMIGSVRNCLRLLGLPLEEALRMASLNPAAYLRLDDRLGRLAPGHRADLVLLDPDLAVLATWVAGEPMWHRT